MVGRIHSIETLGALDGPGLRVVVFLQGCPLRCRYCHNPDTWAPAGGTEMDSLEVVGRVERCKPYFGAGGTDPSSKGGVTLSGGEPLMQSEFCAEVLGLCKTRGIHTALDTCGYRLDGPARDVLSATDLVILDVKHADPSRHRALTGGDLGRTKEFLRYVTDSGIDLWVRQVIVPGWNDAPDDVRALAELLKGAASLKKVELMPYHSMARGKWEAMGLSYPLAQTPEPDPQAVRALQQLLDEMLARR